VKEQPCQFSQTEIYFLTSNGCHIIATTFSIATLWDLHNLQLAIDGRRQLCRYTLKHMSPHILLRSMKLKSDKSQECPLERALNAQELYLPARVYHAFSRAACQPLRYTRPIAVSPRPAAWLPQALRSLRTTSQD
jgi:hypothetical protein